MLMSPPPPPPDKDFNQKVEVTVSKIVSQKENKKGKKIKFWDAVFSPPFLSPYTEDELVDGIECGDITGLNEDDDVVSIEQDVDMRIIPYQWALRKNWSRLAAVIERYAIIEQQTQPRQQSPQQQDERKKKVRYIRIQSLQQSNNMLTNVQTYQVQPSQQTLQQQQQPQQSQGPINQLTWTTGSDFSIPVFSIQLSQLSQQQNDYRGYFGSIFSCCLPSNNESEINREGEEKKEDKEKDKKSE